MKKYSISLLITLSISFGAIAQTAISKFVNARNLKTANISVMIKDLSTGKIIMEHRAEKNTVPASTTKVLTTSTALETLGPDFKFETKIQYDGQIENGILNGNIYILGSGDPTLGSRHMGDSLFLEKWVAAIKEQGITQINGAVIGDASIYNNEGIAPKWVWEDMGNYYASGAYGISIYDNTYKAVFKSGAVGSTPEIIRTEPEMPGMKFRVFVKASNTKRDRAYFYGAPYSNERLIYGEIPANRKEFVSKGDIPNPPLYAAQVLEASLNKNGISTSKPAMAIFEAGNNRKTIHVLQSPPLSEIISNINHKSNNHYAEQLFRRLSLANHKQASTDKATWAIKKFWRDKGLNTSGMVIYDGCGLSPFNTISAKFLVEVLTYEANKSPYADVFLESLATAGVDGTIENLLWKTKLKGKVKAKSGTLSGVKSYAGYLFWNNKKYAFAVLINNYSGSSSHVIKEIEDLLLSVAK